MNKRREAEMEKVNRLLSVTMLLMKRRMRRRKRRKSTLLQS
jgi:hypothetical protein